MFDYKNYCYGLRNIERFCAVDSPFRQAETNMLQGTALAMWERRRDTLHARCCWPRERLDRWKVRKLSSLVDYAFERVPFYRELYSAVGFAKGGVRTLADFEQLPYVTRKQLSLNYDNGGLADGTNVTQHRLIRSSGSSGNPVSMLVDRGREDRDTLYRLRMFEQMGRFRLSPTHWLYNVHHAVWTYSSLLGRYPVFTISQDCPAEAIASHVLHLQPAVISCVASFAGRLADTGVDLAAAGVRVLSTNSETTTVAERGALARRLGVGVCDEYSAEELGLIATECSFGRYHVVEDDCHLEVVDADAGGLGSVVGTDLWNRVRPIIRYRVGDLVVRDDCQACPCGSTFRTLKAVFGRADQAFVSNALGTISPGSLMEACDQFLVPTTSHLVEFRLVQHSTTSVELIAVRQTGHGAASPTHLRAFEDRMSQLFGYPVDLAITYVPAIPPEASYKRRTIINRIPSASSDCQEAKGSPC